jgi:hypothetical protein
MRPVPQTILLALLAAMCGLCAVQWWRESALREQTVAQRSELLKVAAERDELAARAKDADAEILRLTGALSDLRTQSVSKQEHHEALAANGQMRGVVEKQNAAIKEQNEAIAKQNAAVLQANEIIRKVSAERDDLAKRINEVTALYNKLARPSKRE